MRAYLVVYWMDAETECLLSDLGIMRAGGPGRWHLLPLGLRARTKLERLIVRELERVGCQQVSLPLVTPAQLWKQSGRLDTMVQLTIVWSSAPLYNAGIRADHLHRPTEQTTGSSSFRPSHCDVVQCYT